MNPSRLLVPVLAAAGAALPVASSAAEPAKPNVLLFVVDDLGYGDLGCMGNLHAETPNIDAFAREGVRFSTAYAHPGCSPTRAALLTGKHPVRVGITRWIPKADSESEKWRIERWKHIEFAPVPQALGRGHRTVAEVLREAGYATFHLGKWHVGGGPGFEPQDRGFDTVIGYWDGAGPGRWFSPYNNPTLPDGPKGEYITDRLTDEAVRIIGEKHDKPWFLNVWHYDVHEPLVVREQLLQKYRNRGMGERAGLITAEFHAKKEAVDQSFGRIVEALKATGQFDNTLILFFSDNGGELRWADNGPLNGGKKTLYEGGIRVPMFASWPARFAGDGRTIATPVLDQDFLPTILEAAGAPPGAPKDRLDGRSFLGLLDGKSGRPESDRVLVWHYPNHYVLGPHSAIREGDWKLVELQGTGQTRLYNLKEDIGEQFDVAAQHPERVEKLRAALDERLKAMGAQFATVKERP